MRKSTTTRTNAPPDRGLRSRIRELETLCAEVYVTAVELGFPRPLLNRLRATAAPRSTPHPPQAHKGPDVAGVREPIRIPDIRLTDRPRHQQTLARPSQPDVNALSQQYTVLVVDDDPKMLEVLVRILQRENYMLLTALTGREALGVAERHDGKIDLLITDFVMPEMQGRELAERMRERDAAIKVLYQTGFSDILFDSRAELEDGTAFLEKPFTARGLREATRFVLLGAISPV